MEKYIIKLQQFQQLFFPTFGSNEVQQAVDICVVLNQWDLGLEIAQQKSKVQLIESLLLKYASHLLDQNNKFQAVHLYRKAQRHTEAAKILGEVILNEI